MRMDPERDALVVVDVQNDFSPGGSLAVPNGDEVVPVINSAIEKFTAAGAPVFATRDWHPEKTKHFEAHGGLWPPHCVQGTRGAEFHPGLRLPPSAGIMSKGMDPEEDAYSAFQARDAADVELAIVLGTRGIRRLFVAGLATDYCVKATALDALHRDFQVVVLEDAIKAVDLNPGDGDTAIEEMKVAGARFIKGSEL
jgi:nicotinamidase/pyrazinamidase